MKNLIRQILREEIQGELDFDGIPDNEPISFNKNEIKSKIKRLGTFLYRPEGLGIQSVIDKKLSELSNNIPSYEQVVQKRYANELHKSGKISDSELKRFLWNLKNKKLVYVDGKWHQVNKINTNYVTWSQLLTDMFFENNMNEILQGISESSNESQVKDILLKNKDLILNTIDNTFDTDDLIDISEKMIGTTNKIGEQTESEAVEWLKDKGMRVLRVGGDGDLLDMVFGIDIIAGFQGKLYTIQVKTTENQGKQFIEEYMRGRHRSIDILLFKDRNGEIKPVKMRNLLKK